MPKLFKTDVHSDAELKVFVTDIRSDAHLVIFETTDAWAATEQPIWCYTDIRTEADKVVYFTSSLSIVKSSYRYKSIICYSCIDSGCKGVC